jgi:probable poly-beta-1,6-N-acetyl-D-glucosamine export protein
MNSSLKLQAELFGLFLFSLVFLHKNIRNFAMGNKHLQDPHSKPMRNSSIDMVRGIAMCGIILIHVHSYFSYFKVENSFLFISGSIANLSRFSVPVFILTSGIFISYKGNLNFWKSRLIQLVIPYTLFGLLGFLIKYPISDGWIFEFLKKFFLGTIYEPYYYIPLLFQFYLLYALFFKNSNAWSISQKWAYFLTSLIANLFSNQFFPTGGNWQFIEPLVFSNFLFFFIFGLIAKPILSESTEFLALFSDKKIKLTLYFTTTLYVVYLILLTFTTGTGFSNHLIFYPIVCFLLLFYGCINLEKNSSSFSKIIVSILSYIGKNSLFVFLLHPILIHLLHAYHPYTFGGKFLSYFVIFILNLIIPLGVGEMYNKIQKSFLGLKQK